MNMLPPFRDIYVNPISEDRLAEFARKWRQQHGAGLTDTIDAVEFLIDTVLPLSSIALKILFFEQDREIDPPAYVDFSSRSVNFDGTIWRMANNLDGHAQFVVAHECVHLLIHNHIGKSFSVNPRDQVRYGENEHSAEWQANTAAGYLILPDELVSSFSNAKTLADKTGAWQDIAQIRFKDFHDRRKPPLNDFETGIICPKCGSFGMRISNGRLTCNSCN